MSWPSIDDLAARAPLPEGYRYQLLSRSKVPELGEGMGRAIGMGMVYGLPTLRYPHMQAHLRANGWQLIAITPGFDQEARHRSWRLTNRALFDV